MNHQACDETGGQVNPDRVAPTLRGSQACLISGQKEVRSTGCAIHEGNLD